MSSAVLERIVDRPKTPELVSSASPSAIEKEPADPHPLLPVFVAGAVSLIIAVAFIGTVLMCLALRHSGVLAK